MADEEVGLLDVEVEDQEVGTLDLEVDDEGSQLVGEIEIDESEQPKLKGESFLKQAEPESFGDKVIPLLKSHPLTFGLFDDPKKEKAKATQALVDAEIFKIKPSQAYDFKKSIDRVAASRNSVGVSREELGQKVLSFQNNPEWKASPGEFVGGVTGIISNTAKFIRVVEEARKAGVEEYSKDVDPNMERLHKDRLDDMREAGHISEEEYTKKLADIPTDIAKDASPKKTEKWINENIYEPTTKIAEKVLAKTEEVTEGISRNLLPQYVGTFAENPSWRRGFSSLMSGVSSMAVAIPISAIAGPGAGAAILSMAESGPVYEFARSKGKTESEAISFAITTGLATFFLEKYGLEKVMGAKGTRVQRFFKGATAESTTEISQTIVQNAIKKYGIDESINIFDEIIESAIGGLVGGPTSVMFGSQEVVSEVQKDQIIEASEETMSSLPLEEQELFVNLAEQEPNAMVVDPLTDVEGNIVGFRMVDMDTANTFEVGANPTIEEIKQGRESVKELTEIDTQIQTMLEMDEENFEAEISRLIADQEDVEIGEKTERFKSQILEFVTEKQANAVVALLGARAKAVDMTTDEYIEYHGIEVQKGVAEKETKDTLSQQSSIEQEAVMELPENGSATIKPGQLGPGIKTNKAVEDYKTNIQKTGLVKPIEITKDGFIVDGEHRYKAMMELGIEKIPVYVGEQLGSSGRLKKPYPGILVEVKQKTTEAEIIKLEKNIAVLESQLEGMEFKKGKIIDGKKDPLDTQSWREDARVRLANAQDELRIAKGKQSKAATEAAKSTAPWVGSEKIKTGKPDILFQGKPEVPVFITEDEKAEKFKVWSKGHEVVDGYEISDIKDGEGKVFKVSHGTTNEFDIFDPTIKGMKEGHFGQVNYFTSDQGDADINYAGEGPDLTNRIENRKEQIEQELEDMDEDEAIELAKQHGLEFDPDTETYPEELPEILARKELVGAEPKRLDVFVRLDNPAYVGGETQTVIENFDEAALREDAKEQILEENDADESQAEEFEDDITDRYYEIQSFEEPEILNAIQQALYEVETDENLTAESIYSALELYDGEITATELNEKLRDIEELSYAHDYEGQGEIIQSHIIGLIFKHLGFDGIVLQNANKQFPGMDMGSETAHVHVFDTPTQIKSQDDNIGTFDPNDPNILKQDKGQTSPTGETKASVTFTDTQTIITAFEGADVSSLVHELGHVFRRDLASTDLEIAENWAGVKDGKWSVKSEEKFARGFEKYLADGKAPTPELQRVFNQLKQWLTEIYRVIKGSSIDIEITPEIQGVFDRLLTESEIAENEGLDTLQQKAEPIKTQLETEADFVESHYIDSDVKGYSEQQVQDYYKEVEGARKEAVKVLDKQYAKEDSIALSAIKKEAQGIIESTGIFKAWSDIVEAGGIKIDSAKKLTDNETIKKLLRARPGLFKKNGTVYPDVIANDYGFDTADELFQSWVELGTKKEAVKLAMRDLIQEYELASEKGREFSFVDDIVDTGSEVLNKKMLKKKPVSRRIKSVIRKETGQAKDNTKTISDREALKEVFKRSAMAARKALSEGNKAGVIKEKIRMKEILTRASERRKKSASIKQIRARIKRELKFSKAKKVSGKVQGKFTPEIQATLDKLIEVSKLKKAEAEDRLISNLEKYAEEVPQEIALENHLLELVARVDTMTDPDQMQGLLDEIKALKDEGRLINNLRAFNRSEEIRAKVETTIEELGGVPDDLQIKGIQEYTAKTISQRAKQSLKTFGKTMSTWDWIMDMLSSKTKVDPGKSFISQDNNLNEYKNTEKRGTKETLNDLNQRFMEAFGLKTNRQTMNKILKDKAEEIVFKNMPMQDPITGKPMEVDLTFTRSELRKRAMELLDPSLWPSFQQMGYTEKTAIEISEALTPQDKVFIDSAMEFWREYYHGNNEVYKRVTGVNLPYNPFYSAISREGVSKPVETGMSEFLTEMSFRASAQTAGALKARVGSTKHISKQNDFSVLERHVSEMEHFKAWAERIRDLNSVWKDPNVRAAVEINHGKDILFLVDKHISDIATGNITTGKLLKGVDKFRVNFVKAALAGKPSMIPKQLSSFIAFAEKMPVNQFVKNMVLFWESPVKHTKEIYTSDMLQSRGQNIERDLKAAAQSKEHAAFAKHQSFINMLMLPIQVGDQGAIVAGGWPYYKWMKDQGKTHDEAISEMEKFSDQTQQSADITEQSYWQRGGPLAKLFTMFMSSPNLYYQKEIGAIRNLLSGRQGIKQTAKTIAIYHIILPSLFQLMSDRFTWDEDEQKRAMILGALNGWFIVGDGLDWMLRKAMGMQPFNMEVPVYSVAHDIIKATALVDAFDLTAEEFFRAISGLAGVVGAGTGIPAKQAVTIGKGAYDVLDGEYEKGITELMGYSPYKAEKLAED